MWGGGVAWVLAASTILAAPGASHAAEGPPTGQGTIVTVAGNGIDGYCGDGRTATSACLSGPGGVDVGPFGEIYIADTYNGRIRRVDRSGTIETVAGSGARGYAGDGGPATDAVLFYPMDVALDGDGGFYVADTFNDRVRRVDPSGTITTVAGGGSGSSCEATGIPATQACLLRPHGVAVGPDDLLYIADTGANRIVKVSSSGDVVAVAGTGARGFSGDGGPATLARLDMPEGVDVDASGTVLIADTRNHRVRRVDALGVIGTVAGSGCCSPFAEPEGYAGGTLGEVGDGDSATDASLEFPGDVAAAGGDAFYVADTYHHRVRHVDASGRIETVAGRGVCSAGSVPIVGLSGRFFGDGGRGSDACLSVPLGVVVGPLGRVFVADTWNARIRRVEVGRVADRGIGTSRAYAIEGRVLDPLRRPLDGALVDDGRQVALTAPDGWFRLDEESSGPHTLRIERGDTYRLWGGAFAYPPGLFFYELDLEYAVRATWAQDPAGSTLTVYSSAPRPGSPGDEGGRSCLLVIDAETGTSIAATLVGAEPGTGAGIWEADPPAEVDAVRLRVRDCETGDPLAPPKAAPFGPTDDPMPGLPTDPLRLWTDTPRPLIGASAFDGGSGVDPDSIRVRVDGEVLPVFWESASGFVHLQARAHGLEDGDHTVEVRVADRAGNVGTLVYVLAVDGATASLTENVPVGTSASRSPTIGLQADDAASGVDPDRIEMTLGNGVVTSHLEPVYDPATGSITYEVPDRFQSHELGGGPLPDGEYEVVVRVADRAGNRSQLAWSFEVDTLS